MSAFNFVVVYVPRWGCWLHDASWWGWRWCIVVGPWLIFLGMSPGLTPKVRRELERRKEKR